MKKNYILLSIAALLFYVTSQAQQLSADEIEFAQTGNLSIQTRSAKMNVHTVSSPLLRNAGLVGCDSLETLYTAGNGQSGVMFDVVALQGLTIQYFYSNLAATTSGFRIYYKTGSYDGFQGDSTAWTFIGSASVTAATTNVPTFIPIPVNVAMNLGDTVGFYLTRVGTGNISYTNGIGVNTLYTSDSALAFFEGNGVAYPFGNIYTPRVWNGTIKYCTGSTGVKNLSTHDKASTAYFNSSSEQIVLDVENALLKNNSALEFRLTDLYGKTVLNSKITSAKHFFNTANLPKGIYISSVISNNTQLKQQKIVVY